MVRRLEAVTSALPREKLDDSTAVQSYPFYGILRPARFSLATSQLPGYRAGLFMRIAKTRSSGGSLSAIITILAAILVRTVAANTITFENYDLLASYDSNGLIDLGSIGTWNGRPVSDTNKPTDFQRELSATLNFFAKPTEANKLFLQVTDVVATHFGFAFGRHL